MKRFRLKEKFRAAVISGAAAFGLMAGCTRNLPEEQPPPDRPRTEWVADTSRGGAPIPEKNSGSLTPNTPDGRPSLKPFLPAHKSRDIPAERAHPADRSDPAPAIEKDTVKAETVPTLPPPRLAPNPVDIKPVYVPLQTAPLQLGLPKTEEAKWKFKLYASHAFTRYFPSDITMKTSRYDVKIKDYEWLERGSREFFNPRTWSTKGNNPAQIFDEPTNAYTLAMEKNAHVLFVSAFHPKFTHNMHQVKHITGTIDGVPVDAVAPVNRPFDGYNQSPGEMELTRNENTHLQMEFEAGYAHKFSLLSSRKFGTVSFVPGISAGVQMGRTTSVVVQKDKWWDYDGYTENYKIQGLGGSLRSKIEWTGPRERFGIFYENKAAFYHRKHGLLDGTQEYNLRYTSNSFGMTFMLYNPNKHKSCGGPKL